MQSRNVAITGKMKFYILLFCVFLSALSCVLSQLYIIDSEQTSVDNVTTRDETSQVMSLLSIDTLSICVMNLQPFSLAVAFLAVCVCLAFPFLSPGFVCFVFVLLLRHAYDCNIASFLFCLATCSTVTQVCIVFNPGPIGKERCQLQDGCEVKKLLKISSRWQNMEPWWTPIGLPPYDNMSLVVLFLCSRWPLKNYELWSCLYF